MSAPFRGLVLLSLVVLTATLPARAQEGDPAAGEKIFRRCVVCHTASADENKRGPSLKGVVGRKAATFPGYPYSEAMRSAASAGLVWDEEHLATFLKRPQAMVKGTWMAFPGLSRPQEIDDLIAFLKQHAE